MEKHHLSKLECLPAELLDIIYRYAVVEENMVIAATRTNRENKWISNEPSLARTNRFFRHGVLPVYYKENTFTFPQSQTYPYVLRERIEAWLLAIGDAINLIEWVGAVHSVDSNLTYWARGRVRKAEMQVYARLSDATYSQSLQRSGKARVWSEDCECDLDDRSLCGRIRPVEHRLRGQLEKQCECMLVKLVVCRTIFVKLPLHRQLSYAMHFCHSYPGWWDPRLHSLHASKPCRECSRPTHPTLGHLALLRRS